jgi:hypothetical protein
MTAERKKFWKQNRGEEDLKYLSEKGQSNAADDRGRICGSLKPALEESAASDDESVAACKAKRRRSKRSIEKGACFGPRAVVR